MKKTYIVAVLMLQGIRKQPFESGEVVTPDNFPSGQFEALIEKGFIKEKPDETDEEKAKREAKEAEEAAAAEDSGKTKKK